MTDKDFLSKKVDKTTLQLSYILLNFAANFGVFGGFCTPHTKKEEP